MRSITVNIITVTGTVATEPDMRFTADGEPRTALSLVCAQPTPRDPHALERLRLVAWGDPLAAQCNDLLPGTRVLVEGRLQSNTSDDPADRARFPVEVCIHDLILLADQQRQEPEATGQPVVHVAAPPVTSNRSAPTAPAVASPPRPAPPACPRVPHGPRRAG